MLLAFPDAYEIGLSNIGIRIIHHILNERPDTAAELTFAPWPDAEAEMRRLGIPLFSLDSHAPAGDVRRASASRSSTSCSTRTC